MIFMIKHMWPAPSISQPCSTEMLLLDSPSKDVQIQDIKARHYQYKAVNAQPSVKPV